MLPPTVAYLVLTAPPPPAWVDDVVRPRRDYGRVARELHWVKASRAYRVVTSLWPYKESGPTPLSDPDAFEEHSP